MLTLDSANDRLALSFKLLDNAAIQSFKIGGMLTNADFNDFMSGPSFSGSTNIPLDDEPDEIVTIEVTDSAGNTASFDVSLTGVSNPAFTFTNPPSIINSQFLIASTNKVPLNVAVSGPVSSTSRLTVSLLNSSMTAIGDPVIISPTSIMSGVASFAKSFDADSLPSAAYSFDLSFSGLGMTTLNDSKSFTIDKDRPTIDSEATMLTLDSANDRLALSFKLLDNAAIQSFKIGGMLTNADFNDFMSGPSFSGSTNIPLDDEPDEIVTIEVTDSAGNTASFDVSLTGVSNPAFTFTNPPSIINSQFLIASTNKVPLNVAVSGPVSSTSRLTVSLLNSSMTAIGDPVIISPTSIMSGVASFAKSFDADSLPSAAYSFDLSFSGLGMTTLNDSKSFTIDRSAPLLTSTITPLGETNRFEVTINDPNSGIKDFMIGDKKASDFPEFMSGDKTFTTTVEISGNTLLVTALDVAGNTSEKTFNTAGGNGPEVLFNGLTDNSFINNSADNTLTINLSVNGSTENPLMAMGAVNIEIRNTSNNAIIFNNSNNDGNPYSLTLTDMSTRGTLNRNINIASFEDGEILIIVNVTDGRGNITNQQLRITIDRSIPTIEGTFTAVDEGKFILNATLKDDKKIKKILIDGVEYTDPNTAEFGNTVIIENKEFNKSKITVDVFDTAENKASKGFDALGGNSDLPNITINTPATDPFSTNKDLLNIDLKVDGTAQTLLFTDAVNIKITDSASNEVLNKDFNLIKVLNSSNVISGGKFVKDLDIKSINDGSYTLNITIKGINGNGEKKINLIIDRTAPALTGSGLGRSSTPGKFEATIKAKDNISSITFVSINGVEVTIPEDQRNKNEINFTTETSENPIELVVKDSLGNTSRETYSVNDNLPPTINITAPQSSFFYNTLRIAVRGIVNGTGSDIKGVTVNGATATLSANNTTSNISNFAHDLIFDNDGQKEITINAEDTGNNTVSTSTKVTIDTINPELTVEVTQTGENNFTVKGTGKGTGSPVHAVTINGNPIEIMIETGVEDISFNTNITNLPIEIEITDKAGNSTSRVITKANRSIPEVTIIEPSNGATINNNTITVKVKIAEPAGLPIKRLLLNEKPNLLTSLPNTLGLTPITFSPNIGSNTNEQDISIMSQNRARTVSDFTTNITLIPGENLIKVSASNEEDNESTSIIKVTYIPEGTGVNIFGDVVTLNVPPDSSIINEIINTPIPEGQDGGLVIDPIITPIEIANPPAVTNTDLGEVSSLPRLTGLEVTSESKGLEIPTGCSLAVEVYPQNGDVNIEKELLNERFSTLIITSNGMTFIGGFAFFSEVDRDSNVKRFYYNTNDGKSYTLVTTLGIPEFITIGEGNIAILNGRDTLVTIPLTIKEETIVLKGKGNKKTEVNAPILREPINATIKRIDTSAPRLVLKLNVKNILKRFAIVNGKPFKLTNKNEFFTSVNYVPSQNIQEKRLSIVVDQQTKKKKVILRSEINTNIKPGLKLFNIATPKCADIGAIDIPETLIKGRIKTSSRAADLILERVLLNQKNELGLTRKSQEEKTDPIQEDLEDIE